MPSQYVMDNFDISIEPDRESDPNHQVADSGFGPRGQTDDTMAEVVLSPDSNTDVPKRTSGPLKRKKHQVNTNYILYLNHKRVSLHI